jgi:hypothetical protein
VIRLTPKPIKGKGQNGYVPECFHSVFYYNCP